jgi:hypothetical protein
VYVVFDGRFIGGSQSSICVRRRELVVLKRRAREAPFGLCHAEIIGVHHRDTVRDCSQDQTESVVVLIREREGRELKFYSKVAKSREWRVVSD